MKDILGKEIVGYKEALYLKEAGFDGKCTGYYHCDDYGDEEPTLEDARYECAGWRGLFQNSQSIYRAAAPSTRAAKMWYTKNKVKPFNKQHKYSPMTKYAIQQRFYHVGQGWGEWSIDFERTFDNKTIAEEAIADDNLSDTAQYRVVEIAHL